MNNSSNQPKFPPNIKNVPSLTKNPMMDMFLTYQFLKRIVVPFEKSDAYKLGIIDKSGKVLKKKKTLKTDQEKAAWGYFDILTNNLKKLLAKIPGGSSILGSSVASYLLIKEHKSDLLLNEVYFETQFMKVYTQLTEENMTEAEDLSKYDPKIQQAVKSGRIHPSDAAWMNDYYKTPGDNRVETGKGAFKDQSQKMQNFVDRMKSGEIPVHPQFKDAMELRGSVNKGGSRLGGGSFGGVRPGQSPSLDNPIKEEGEVPANNVGSGEVKGFDPLLIKKAKGMLRRKKPYVDTKLPS